MRFRPRIGKRSLAARLTALVALALILIPSLGYTAVSLSMDLCGCSDDSELACYCCIGKDGHHSGHDSDRPCYSHSCKAGQKSNLWLGAKGETAFTPEGSAALIHTARSGPVSSVHLLLVPVRTTLIEKPPA